MNYPPIDRLAELQQMIADFAKIERVAHLDDGRRLENDVEHSYGVALICWYLQPKIAPELDMLKIFKYALSHDIVELHAGDTYFLDQEALRHKDVNERQAANQIEQDWPDFLELTQYARNYMDKLDEEAKFVKAVDKLVAPLVVQLDRTTNIWIRKGINLKDIQNNKVSIHVSKYLSPYYDQLIEWLDECNTIPKD